MEEKKILIKSFGPLKDIEIKIKKVNILIGETSSGKSIVSKLIFIFLTFWERINPNIFITYHNKALKEAIYDSYIKIFQNSYSNGNVIFYYSEKEFINLLIKDKKIEISLSKILTDKFAQLKQHIKDLNMVKQCVKESLNLENVIYFPAGRNFLINLKENIFTMIESGSKIDYLLSRFGKHYEYYKTEFNKLHKKDKSILKYISKILKGKYKYLKKYDEERFYINSRTYIPLNQISSGQQETLPALIVLWGIMKYETSYFILFEEPEAHLSPLDQKNLIEFLIFAVNYKPDNKILISTHSPYTLTVINNLLQAKNSVKNDSEKQEKVKNIIPENLWIDFEDVNGIELRIKKKHKIILSKSNKLIDTNMIDKISNNIAEQFDQLLTIEFD